MCSGDNARGNSGVASAAREHVRSKAQMGIGRGYSLARGMLGRSWDGGSRHLLAKSQTSPHPRSSPAGAGVCIARRAASTTSINSLHRSAHRAAISAPRSAAGATSTQRRRVFCDSSMGHTLPPFQPRQPTRLHAPARTHESRGPFFYPTLPESPPRATHGACVILCLFLVQMKRCVQITASHSTSSCQAPFQWELT